MKSPWTVMPKFSRSAVTGGVYFWRARHSMHCHGLKRCKGGDGPFLRRPDRQGLRPVVASFASISISFPSLRNHTNIYDNIGQSTTSNLHTTSSTLFTPSKARY